MGAIDQAFNKHGKGGQSTTRIMFVLICVLLVAQVICSLAVAVMNTKSGLKSASFAAIWSMFLVIIGAYLGYRIAMHPGKNSPMVVGMLIGYSATLVQLFFFLSVTFFSFGTWAKTTGSAAHAADNGYGSFSLFNFIVYFIWTYLLWSNRQALGDSSNAQNHQEDEDGAEGEEVEEEEEDPNQV